MVGGVSRTFAQQTQVLRLVLCVLLLALPTTACIWRSYADILSVHVDVVTQTAAKLCSVIEAGLGPTAEGMAEYVYPAQRAREFLKQSAGYSERESYKRLGELLDRYEAMVRRVDAARANPGETKLDRAALDADRDGLMRLAEAARIAARDGR